MSSVLQAECPCCGLLTAGDLNEIEKLFGFRNMKDGKKICQSYCRHCRSKHCRISSKRCKN
ncbi:MULTISPECIES: hemagglutinin [unclassified Photobacterium]|uniref:hemagglutinin n=1 Tax=unclassified Photobacterium TaxID=2628852 RepID=UPI001EDF2E89|nr:MULTISPECIES: hemagglutinin [unclassified Photobacterium]MCG3865811.1 hemagglutinin [Photobacterium sp. Ph6]MCG3877286.1 hemagglutinin [Photobacterium sp. Ph5]